MTSARPMPLQRGFALLVAFALLLGALVPFVAPVPARAATPTDLFFSEYVEGSSFNKVLEIYNGTGAPVDLGAYTVELYSNGAASVSFSVALSGTLAAGDVFVLAHGSASSVIEADLRDSSVVNFNGDDAVALRNGGVAVDVIGQIGFDPGSTWGSDPTTADHTLVRKSAAVGDPNGGDAFDPATEWDGFPSNTFSHLGAHDPTDGLAAFGANAEPPTAAPGAAVNLSVLVRPGANPTSTDTVVVADLTPIGGSAAQPFVAEGDNAFTYSAVVAAGTTGGAKAIEMTASDAQGRQSTTTIDLDVIAPPAPSGIVISEFRTRGPSGGNDELIEINNTGTGAVDIGGWQVRASNNAATVGVRATIPDGTVIQPGCFYLLTNSASGGYSGSVAGDQTYATGVTDTGGVALVATTSVVADQVGMSTTSAFKEGTTLAPLTVNADQAYERKPGGTGGHATDTDDNAADFALISPSNPQNSASTCIGETPADQAPFVSSTFPADGSVGAAVDEVLSVSFSEAVDLAGGWFDITCSLSGAHTAVVSGGPASYAIDPDADFTNGDTCTVTISAAAVTDQDTDDPPDTMVADEAFSFSVGTICGNASHRIHDIQGSGSDSLLDGETVTVEGVVVGDYQGDDPGLGGFNLQEEDDQADTDPLTSEGIFVFDGTGSVAVEPGDVVSATGRVDEFFGLTEITSVDDVRVCDSGASVTPGSPELPVDDPAELERFEGMLVTFDQTLTVTENFTLGRFGELVLSATGRQWQGTHLEEPGADALAVHDANMLARIVLDDGDDSENPETVIHPAGGLTAENTVRTGATVDDLTAVMDFDFGLYRLQPTGEVAFEDGARPTAPPEVGGRIQVAAFNVLNYFNGNGDGTGFPTSRGATSHSDFVRQHDKIVSAIAAMDAEVIGLMEIENDGADAIPAVSTLVDGLNAELEDEVYDYVVTGAVGTDAIAVAIIYQPAEVTPRGDFAVLDSSVDPRFDEDRNRAALAQSFTENETGAAFTVSVNHLKSKGSGCGTGDDQPDHLGGNCNATRTAAAMALVDWLASDPTGSGDADAMIIGDLNSYAMEDPIDAVKAAGYTDLLAEFVGEDAYTYVFEGASGYLDHALASESVAGQVTGAAPWHINADEPRALEYSTEFGSDTQDVIFYAPDAYRSSDHDPVLVGLDLELHAPEITSLDVTADPVEVGDEVQLSATFTDADGGETHTATINWGDGNAAVTATVDQDADTVAASHEYANAGLYTVTLTVTDSGQLAASETFSYVFVFDPAAGFVTGGGQVTTDDGIAAFEISLKYETGEDVPEGGVVFGLPGLAFEATGYDVLVVSGTEAWLTGEGTLNGEEGYAFLLAVNDGPDRLRMRISDPEGEVVFDNQPGDPTDASASEPIRNGQIKVHADQGPASNRTARRS